MTTHPTVQQPVVAANCPVCGSFMLSHQVYCADCEKWEEQISDKRKYAARRAKFGDFL